MLKDINLNEFIAEFKAYDRDYYSCEGYKYLFDLCEELDIKLDVIGLCCDFTEYTLEDYITSYLSNEEINEVMYNYDYEDITDITYNDLEYMKYINYSNMATYISDDCIMVQE